MEPPAAATPELVGTSIDKYRVVRAIAEGGMAVVYEAFDPEMQRRVALKIFDSAVATETKNADRFLGEARAAAGLHHPHILPVYDFGFVNGLGFLVMPFMERGSLADRMSAGRLDRADALTRLSQVASALDYAHAKGIIHRDVKPANVLLDERDACQLTDFGLAKMLASPEAQAASSGFVGTPRYMAPEQVRGAAVDARVDVYSLGAMAFELLTGGPPYVARTPLEECQMHLLEPPRDPRAVDPSIPDHVAEALLRALDRDPDRRFRTASALVTALREPGTRVLTPAAGAPGGPSAEGAGVTDRPAAAPARAPRRRGVPLRALATAVLAALVCGSLWPLNPGAITIVVALAWGLVTVVGWGVTRWRRAARWGGGKAEP